MPLVEGLEARGGHMGKLVICSEVGFDCPGRIEAPDADAALASVAAHARAVHGVEEPTVEIVDRVLAVMRDTADATR